MKTSLNTIDTTLNSKSIIDLLINDPETKMRMGIKDADDMVKNDTKNRNLKAPLTTEEKILLSI